MKHHLAAVTLFLAASAALAAPRVATENPGPQKSGFYDFYTLAAESPGIGQVTTNACAVPAASQASYAPNWIRDCDGEVPHNETPIVVNPANPEHAVGGYHSYQLHFLGATVVNHVVGTVSVTFDGGRSWRQVTPPITPTSSPATPRWPSVPTGATGSPTSPTTRGRAAPSPARAWWWPPPTMAASPGPTR
jgi:hypothetical protein